MTAGQDPERAASAARFKRGMRGAYDDAATRYAQYIAPSFTPIARRLVALARPQTDELHLDLATGTGLVPALIDGRRMATCIIPWRAALDLSLEMLRAARQVAPSTRVAQADLEYLPIRSETADLLTLCLALHHLPSPARALVELRRVLRPRGRLVLAAWGDELSSLWRAFDAWFERAGLGESRSVQQSDLPLDTPERLRAALLDVAGFGSAEVFRERPPLRFPSLADFWEWRISFPATRRALSALAPAEQVRLRADALAALAELAGPGEVVADQAVLFAVAHP